MAHDGSAPVPDEFTGKPIEFELILPVTDDTLRANVAHSRTLGIPEADDRAQHLTLVANGPSAAGAELGNGMTMALNGALNLFPDDNPPDFWCVSDPQALVADFIKRPSHATTFLVASKCHPAVFERLRGFDVRLWHLTDVDIPGVRSVPCATSVTLTALILAQRLGFRSIDVWGWDCCFGEDGRHHAGDGEMGVTAGVIDIRVGPEEMDARFRTTPTWALEAQEAVGILPLLRWAGVDVTVHGLGLVRARLPEYAAHPLPLTLEQGN